MENELALTETQKPAPGGGTEYRIVGSFDLVIGRVREILKEYHPVGYGTTVSLEHQFPTADTWLARMWRANSCD